MHQVRGSLLRGAVGRDAREHSCELRRSQVPRRREEGPQVRRRRLVSITVRRSLSGSDFLCIDEDEEAKDEEASLKAMFEPLAEYLKKELSDSINDGWRSLPFQLLPALIFPVFQSSSRPASPPHRVSLSPTRSRGAPTWNASWLPKTASVERTSVGRVSCRFALFVLTKCFPSGQLQ